MSPEEQPKLEGILSALYTRTALGIEPGLSVTERLVEGLGHPERSFLVVHVAGTNGKGSLCAMVDSILRASGFRVGLYTSPHLIDFNERFRVQGEPIANDALAPLIEQVLQLDEQQVEEQGDRPATFFELSTAMAFQYFSEQQVDVAVIETGLGGIWDSTNVVIPAVCAITRVDLDHAEFLGEALEGIAAEKAGIIKAGRPVVVGGQHESAGAVISARAQEFDAPLIDALSDVSISRVSLDRSGVKFSIATHRMEYGICRLPLLGRHQIEHAAIAVAVCEELLALADLELVPKEVKRGFSDVVWPGRLQLLSETPPVLLDGAHNPAAAVMLRETIESLFKGMPLAMVCGFSSGKDVQSMIATWKPLVRAWFPVTFAHERSMDEEGLRDVLAESGVEATITTLSRALSDAQHWANEQEGVVCIAGSLFLVGEVLNIYSTQQGKETTG